MCILTEMKITDKINLMKEKFIQKLVRVQRAYF